jgi:tRNA(adenine34) deaminase
MAQADPQAEVLDRAMMQRALSLAQQAAAVGEVPVGAVVYRRGDGQILGEGHNRRELDADPTAHAEMLAIRQAAATLETWRLDGCAIAVTLEPCPMCAGALINSRIDRLVYGAADPKMGCVRTLYQLCTDARFNHRLQVIAGVLAEPCGAILTQFFHARRGAHRPPKPRANR